MTNKNGIVKATFDKEGKAGYRIRDDKMVEDWYLLDDSRKLSYNPGLKNKQVEFDFIVVADGKRDKKILTFIQEDGAIKEEKVEEKSTFSNQNVIPQKQSLPQNAEEHTSREMARDFAAIRTQSLQLAVDIFPLIHDTPELIRKSLDIERYIRTGEY